MTRTIRTDLIGTTHVHVGDKTVVLSAGDEVPDGATVGDHLLAAEDANGDADSGDPADDGTPKQPKASASKAVWTEYAEKLGVVVPDGATKDDIIALVGTPED